MDYAGKKVFVTGHTGFKGQWLTRWLQMMGAEVMGYSLPDDICDYDRLACALQAWRPDIVFHLAAQAVVTDAHRLPLHTFRVNTIGTANVLDAAYRYGCPVVCVTTDKVYAESDAIHPETDTVWGHEPYGGSKAAAEIVASVYRKSYFPEKGIGLATVRAGNCIGGEDFSVYRLVPNAIRSLKAGKPVRVHDPAATRPFQHVLEPLRGYLLVGERLMAGEALTAYNFGPDESWSVQRLVELLIHLWGEGSWELTENTCTEAPYLSISNEKAKRELGWEPVWSTTSAVTATMDWYKGKPMDSIIRSYERAL